MKRAQNIVSVILFLLVVVGKINAQTVVIPDANFRTCLVNNYPTLLNGSDELIIAQAQSFSDTLECINQDIVSVSTLEYFTAIKGLKFSNNEIVDLTPVAALNSLELIDLTSNELEIVPNLSGFTNLTRFYANYNQLDNLPVFPSSIERIKAGNNSLAGTVDFNNYSNLKYLQVFENDYKVIEGLENKPKLEFLDIHDNKLNDLPDLSASVDLAFVDLSLNKFTYEDILPFAGLAAVPTSFPNYDQQDKPEVNETIEVTEDDSWIWALNFDEQVTNNTYSWYKDDQFFTTTSQGVLKLSSVELQDSGKYHCEVTNNNSNLSGSKIITNSKTLKVKQSNCFKLVSAEVEQTTERCATESEVSISAETERTVVGSLRYFLVPEEDDTDTISSETGKFMLYEEGSYSIIVKDDVCTKTATEEVNVVFNLSGCDAEKPYSFSPNGDGNEDVFYIEQKGQAKFYNKRGQLVNQMTVPNQWDGTGFDNQLLDFGLYIIIIDEREKLSVTLLR